MILRSSIFFTLRKTLSAKYSNNPKINVDHAITSKDLKNRNYCFEYSIHKLLEEVLQL